MTGSSAPRPRPVLLYDGGCGFCTRSIEAAVARLDADVDYEPWQATDLAGLGVSPAETARSIVWVGVDGRLRTGSDAAARLLVASGGAWSLLGRLLLAPPFAWVAELAYRLVARHRSRLPGVIPALQRPPDARPRRRTR